MELSRQALEDFVRGIEREREQIDDPYLQSREYGAFVRINKKEELRGCIGNCAPKARLFETVTEMTQAAASRDPRVKPVAKKNSPKSESISPCFRLWSPGRPPYPRDRLGTVLYASGKTRVLLPQVATQYGWDIKTFLEQTCLKAGLRKNA
jgi:AMMECR1 domain-containing protein